MKKLKKIESQLAGPRSVGQNQSRSGSVAESASPSESSDSDSEEDSDYASESEVEIEPEEPSPLPPQRPLDPNKAVEYDIIKAVWAKKGVGLSSTVIRTALGECWDIFKGIRDKWKQKSTSLQQAVEKKDQANIKAYERRTQEQRRLLESCIGLTLKHGHPDIIAKYVRLPFYVSCSSLSLAIPVQILGCGQISQASIAVRLLRILEVSSVNRASSQMYPDQRWSALAFYDMGISKYSCHVTYSKRV